MNNNNNHIDKMINKMYIYPQSILVLLMEHRTNLSAWTIISPIFGGDMGVSVLTAGLSLHAGINY